jgi:hypothetical protein
VANSKQDPGLLLFAPHCPEDPSQGYLSAHVRTPDGEEMPVFGEDSASEIGRWYGAPVQLIQLNHGIFDEASISEITFDTVRQIGRLTGRSAAGRRFRQMLWFVYRERVPSRRTSG